MSLFDSIQLIMLVFEEMIYQVHKEKLLIHKNLEKSLISKIKLKHLISVEKSNQ